MRTLIALAAAGVLAGAPAFADPPIAGVWRLPDNDVRIRIGPCGPSVCGRVVSADKLRQKPGLKDKMNKDPALRERPVKGLVVLWGFKGGPQKWTGGRIYDPDKGETYKGEITVVDPNTLKVSACVLKPLCKSRTLTRAG